MARLVVVVKGVERGNLISQGFTVNSVLLSIVPQLRTPSPQDGFVRFKFRFEGLQFANRGNFPLDPNRRDEIHKLDADGFLDSDRRIDRGSDDNRYRFGDGRKALD